MKNGKQHGLWITFFPDGRPRWKGLKKEGLSHGPFTMWYPDGKKKMEGNYKDGEKTRPFHDVAFKWNQMERTTSPARRADWKMENME